MELAQWKIDSEIGPIYLVASAKGLKRVHWDKQPEAMAKSLDLDFPAVRVLKQAVKELEEYFSGKRQSFTVALDTGGTEFQKKVWAQLMKIPYGKTYSYSDIARLIKNEKAVRAVGTANGRNPVAIIVPCHRVIAADGTLGGYTGGLAKKTRLLKIEQGS